MSILLGAAGTPPVPTNLTIAVAVSIGLMIACRVFVPSKIVGPSRLGEEESPVDISLMALVGLLSWVMAQSIYVVCRQWWYHHVAHIDDPPTKLSDPEIVLFNGFLYIVAFLVLMLIAAFWRPHGLERLGATARMIPSGIWKGILGIVIMLPLVILASMLTDQLWTHFHKAHPEDVALLHILRESPHKWVKWSVVVSAVIIAPLAEETFFRGHIQTILRYGTIRIRWRWLRDAPFYLRCGPWLAILITAALFSSLHPWWTIPPIFLLALGLGYLYERTGNLWACIVTHALFNSASILMFIKA